MTDATSFFVPGRPAPKGSRRYVGQSKAGRAILIESSKHEKPWSEKVRHAARQYAPETPHDGPVSVVLHFRMPRPQRGAKGLRWHVKRPDADKLTRSVLDAITGPLIVEDSRVCVLDVRKYYETPDTPPGVHITVEALTNDL